MKAMHKQALNFAAGHFTISLILGAIWLMQLYGAGLSDVSYPEPLWIEILIVLL